MRIARARHGDSVDVVLQSVCSLVFDRRLGRFLLQVGFKAAALDHEVGDYAMENGSVVKAAVHIVQEVLDVSGAFSASSCRVMSPLLVCSFTIFIFPLVAVVDAACAGKTQSPTSKNARTIRINFMLCGSFIDDLPVPVPFYPVLALVHAVGKIVAVVILFEVDLHQIRLAGVGEDADVRHLDLDPGLAGIDQSLLLRESGRFMAPVEKSCA